VRRDDGEAIVMHLTTRQQFNAEVVQLTAPALTRSWRASYHKASGVDQPRLLFSRYTFDGNALLKPHHVMQKADNSS
jgi:hypothetical protein